MLILELGKNKLIKLFLQSVIEWADYIIAAHAYCMTKK